MGGRKVKGLVSPFVAELSTAHGAERSVAGRRRDRRPCVNRRRSREKAERGRKHALADPRSGEERAQHGTTVRLERLVAGAPFLLQSLDVDQREDVGLEGSRDKGEGPGDAGIAFFLGVAKSAARVLAVVERVRVGRLSAESPRDRKRELSFERAPFLAYLAHLQQVPTDALGDHRHDERPREHEDARTHARRGWLRAQLAHRCRDLERARQVAKKAGEVDRFLHGVEHVDHLVDALRRLGVRRRRAGRDRLFAAGTSLARARAAGDPRSSPSALSSRRPSPSGWRARDERHEHGHDPSGETRGHDARDGSGGERLRGHPVRVAGPFSGLGRRCDGRELSPCANRPCEVARRGRGDDEPPAHVDPAPQEPPRRWPAEDRGTSRGPFSSRAAAIV